MSSGAASYPRYHPYGLYHLPHFQPVACVQDRHLRSLVGFYGVKAPQGPCVTPGQELQQVSKGYLGIFIPFNEFYGMNVPTRNARMRAMLVSVRMRVRHYVGVFVDVTALSIQHSSRLGVASSTSTSPTDHKRFDHRAGTIA